MSGNDTLSALDQEIIAQIPADIASQYSVLSSAALLLYEYFLTFPLELQHIWRGKMNILKILFILNRYCSLIDLYGLVLINFINPATDAECRALYYINEISSIFNSFAIVSIFVLRTYALYSRSRMVLFLLAIPAYLGTASDIWSIVAQTVSAFPLDFQFGPNLCAFSEAASETPGLRAKTFCSFSSHLELAILVGFVCGAIFDALVVILTVYRTGRLAMQSKKAEISGGLSFILLRDGVFYYSTIFVPQFVIVTLDAIVLRTGNVNVNNVSNTLSAINNVLQIVIVNRLVLNLSHSANEREVSESRSRSRMEPPVFATNSLMGNIGGSVRTLPDGLDEEVIEDDESISEDDIQDNTAGVKFIGSSDPDV